MADDEPPESGDTPASGDITITGNVGAGTAVGHGASVTADIIAGGDVNIENYHAYKPKPEYHPPPLPEPDELPAPGALPPGSYLTHRPNPYFTGRKTELLTIAKPLLYREDNRDVIISQTSVASGLGGMGKTQLAVEFAHRYGRYFAGGVYWLNCATAESIPAELAVIGGENGMGLYRSVDNLALDDQVGRVKQAWQEPTPRLLIFDNCEEETVLEAWRPVAGGCRVLVTSRRGRWAGTLGVMQLRLDVLSRPESMTLLRRFVPQMIDKDADAIADELGDLPLALHLAGSFLTEYSNVLTPGAYLAQLQDKKLLEHPSMQGRYEGHSPTGHELHVGRTFALSYDRINPENETDRAAIGLLTCAACFAPGEAIPADLLRATWMSEGNETDADLLAQDGLNRLVSLGLLTQEGETSYQLHRLLVMYVAEVLAVEMEQAQARVEQTVAKKARELNEVGYPASLLAWQNQLRYVAEASATRENKSAGRLLNELGYHLQMTADYAGARPYLERALAIRENDLGPDHPDTALSVNNLGRLLQATGDLTRTREFLERALAIREKALGPNHPDTAQSLNNLGVLLYSISDLTGAQPYLERALTIREKALGIDHPDTANSLNSLGFLLNLMGDAARARELYERALIIRGQVLGTDHPLTAQSLNNLGALLREMGDLTGAQPYCEHALVIREKVLGPDHPLTATSLNSMGMLLRAMGDLAGAQPYYERALAIKKKVLGPDHPLTARSLNNLGFLLKAMGDMTGARRYYEQALAIREKALGPDHPDTSFSLNNLGMLLKDIGDLAGARELYERAQAIREKVLGPDHPRTATSLNNLGGLLRTMGDFDGARSYIERALAIREKALGPDHPDTAQSLNNLGMLLQDMGDLAGARPYFERALEVLEQIFGPHHPNTQIARQNLAALEDSVRNNNE